MIRKLERPSYEERPIESGLLSLEKKRVQGNLITAFQYLNGNYINRRKTNISHR